MSVEDSQTTPKRRSIGRQWRMWVGGILTAATLIWLIATTDWPSTGAALAKANYGLVLVALFSNLLTIPIRAWRWQLVFPHENRPPIGKLTVAMLVGQAVNLVAPARLGDFVRASLVEGQRTAFVLGTQVMQTALDLLMTAVLVLIMLLQVTLPVWWRDSGQALLLTAVIAVIAVIVMALARHPITRLLQAIPQRWPNMKGQRLLAIGIEFLRSLDAFERPSALAGAVALSILLWSVYGLTNFFVLAAFSSQASLLAAFFVLIVLQLGLSIPSSPGRVGVYHYLSIQALAVFPIEQAETVSFAIVLHLISVVIPILIGAWLAWQSGISLTSLRQKAE